MIVEDNSEFYEPRHRELPAGSRCARHPERAAAVVCEECGQPVCTECAPLKGGGHAFCQECLAASRLVDAEPGVLGALAGDEPAPAPTGSVRGTTSPLTGRRLLAAASTLVGAAASYFLYASMKGAGEGPWDARLLAVMSVATCVAFAAFSIFRFAFRHLAVQLTLGALASYLVFFSAPLVSDLCTGNPGEALMWMPVIVLFGIPCMAPLVAMAGLGAILFWPRSSEKHP